MKQYAVKFIPEGAGRYEGLIKIVGKWCHTVYVSVFENLEYANMDYVPISYVEYIVFTEYLPYDEKMKVIGKYMEGGLKELSKYVFDQIILPEYRYTTDRICYRIILYPKPDKRGNIDVQIESKYNSDSVYYYFTTTIKIKILEYIDGKVSDIWDCQVSRMYLYMYMYKGKDFIRDKKILYKKDLDHMGIYTLRDLCKYDTIPDIYKEAVML